MARFVFILGVSGCVRVAGEQGGNRSTGWNGFRHRQHRHGFHRFGANLKPFGVHVVVGDELRDEPFVVLLLNVFRHHNVVLIEERPELFAVDVLTEVV